MTSIPSQVGDRFEPLGNATCVPGVLASSPIAVPSAGLGVGCCRWSESSFVGEHEVVVAMGDDDLLVFQQRIDPIASTPARAFDGLSGLRSA